MLYFHEDVVVREFDQDFVGTITDVGDVVDDLPADAYEDVHDTKTTISLRQKQTKPTTRILFHLSPSVWLICRKNLPGSYTSPS